MDPPGDDRSGSGGGAGRSPLGNLVTGASRRSDRREPLFFSLMPAGIASIILFDYGLDQDLNLPDSSCSHWILRMPIQAWKIAAVPIALKSLWISAIWIIFVLVARSLDSPAIPLIMPCIVFSAVAVWIMVLSWRPFQSSFRRFALLVIAIPVLYCALVGAIAAPMIDAVQWRPLATLASVVAGIALYVGGIWTLVRSTQLARISPGGIIPGERSTRPRDADNAGLRLNETPLPTQHFRSKIDALFHHDYQRSRHWIRGLYAIMVLPTIVIFALFVPVHAASVIMALALFVYYAGFAGSRSFASNNFSSELPVYLAASPLSTKTLAWTRQLFPLVMGLITYGCILFLFAGWACWESNRAIWMQMGASSIVFSWW